MRRFLFFVVVSVLFTPGLIRAQEMGFEELWKRISETSPVLRAAREDLESQKVARLRASFHWIPTLGVEARGYNTDDAGDVLFSKLGARGVSGMDFSPLTMNFPERQNFARVSVGLDWKLFEGGMKGAISEARAFWQASSESHQAVELQKVCGETVKLYSGLLTLREEERALAPVDKVLQKLLDRYRIGSKANPLGHSGLLGLQTLENRIQGELVAIGSKRRSVLSALNEMSGISTAWSLPEKLSALEFAKAVFPGKGEKAAGNEALSATVQAAESSAQGFHAAADAERARFLPQIGLFSQGNYSHALNSSATSVAAGAYLRWELFNPSNWLAVREARARALSLEAQAQALRQYQSASKVRWSETHHAVSEQIKLAEDSLKLMEEQTTIALQLFQSGVLNALQLTDVLARRVELVVARSQMGEEQIKAQAELFSSLSAEEAVCN